MDVPNIAIFLAIPAESLLKGIGLAPSISNVYMRDHATVAKEQGIGNDSRYLSNQHGYAISN